MAVCYVFKVYKNFGGLQRISENFEVDLSDVLETVFDALDDHLGAVRENAP